MLFEHSFAFSVTYRNK